MTKTTKPEVWEDPAKSELVFGVDITKSLHQEGGWYIIPKEYCFFYFGTTPFISHVFHVCSKPVISNSISGAWGENGYDTNPYTCHRVWQKDMKIPCRHCGEVAPDGLIALWTLHNWDYLPINDHDA